MKIKISTFFLYLLIIHSYFFLMNNTNMVIRMKKKILNGPALSNTRSKRLELIVVVAVL